MLILAASSLVLSPSVSVLTVVVTVAALVAAYDIIQRVIRGVYCVAGRPECYEQTMLERLCNIPPYGMGRQLRPQPFPITYLPDGPVSSPADPHLGNPVEQFPAYPPALPTVPPVQITPWPVIIEAISTKWSGKSASGRKDVEELANQIEDLYPGQVLGVDRTVVDPATGNPITDIDVETTNFLIQVKSNNMSKWNKQAEKTLVDPNVNPYQKNVIVFNSGRPPSNQYRLQAAVIKHPSNPNIGVTVYGNNERQTMLRRLP